MLQINLCPFASDALEDAMRLAQTKALNSYTFSDCMNYLNYAWSDIYNRLAMIDSGYFSECVQIKKRLTRLPPYVKNCIKIFAARNLNDFNRQEYRPASNTDMIASGTYFISGMDLLVPDADRKIVWLEYTPQPQQIFFTHHNRDPKIIPHAYTKQITGASETEFQIELTDKPVYNNIYNLYLLTGYDENDEPVELTDKAALSNIVKWTLKHRVDSTLEEDITDYITRDCEDGEWIVTYISCKFPYIFVSYVHSITGEHVSGFLTKDMEWTEYNPFAYTGLNSNVEYIRTEWNDKTGMGVTVQDYNDIINDEDEVSNGQPRVKELGWTPDTKLIYPDPTVYRYLVARLADKLSALNESNVMGVQKELVEAEFAFDAFLNKNKAGFTRIRNVNPVTAGDLL